MIWAFLFYLPAFALPPLPGCETTLVPAAARSAYLEARAANPEYERAFVGNLVSAWRMTDGSVGTWGIFDSHDRRKIYRLRLAHVHPTKSGDRVLLYDRTWNMTAAGDLEFRPQMFTERDLMGHLTYDRTPAFASGNDRSGAELARRWIESPRAIVLSNMDAAERERWQGEQAADFEAWSKYTEHPTLITGPGFTYELAHFERAIEGILEWVVHGNGIDLFVRVGPLRYAVERGDYLLSFDANGAVTKQKVLDLRGRIVSWGESVDPAEIVSRLEASRRLVVVKNHYFLNEEL